MRLMNAGGPYTTSLYIWNDRDGELGLNQTMIGVSLGLMRGNGEIDDQELVLDKEVVGEKWVSVKSNGFLRTGIVDDAEAGYTPIGGAPRHPIVDIPSNVRKKRST